MVGHQAEQVCRSAPVFVAGSKTLNTPKARVARVAVGTQVWECSGASGSTQYRCARRLTNSGCQQGIER